MNCRSLLVVCHLASIIGVFGCGDATTEPPVEIVDIVAFGHSTCTLDSRAELRCWGAGVDGFLGYAETENIGDNEDWCEPGSIDLGFDVRSVHVLGGKCAIGEAGDARCWGPGLFGFEFTTPGELPREGLELRGPSGLVELAQGADHACALLDTGAVRCWGAGVDLGYGDSVDRGIGEDPNDVLAEIDDVPLGAAAVHIEAGASVDGGHTCALLDSGGVRCWGSEITLGYGLGVAIGDDETPEQVGDIPLGGPAVALAAGGTNWCALVEGGELYCWGRDAPYGLLGYGDIFEPTEHVGDDETPLDMGPVPVGEPVEAVFMGYLRTCVLLAGHRARCWGSGFPGLLGYGPSVSGLDEPPAADIEIGDGVRDLALGVQHTCALLDSGRVRCWGVNDSGQLGLGQSSPMIIDASPVDVPTLPECNN